MRRWPRPKWRCARECSKPTWRSWLFRASWPGGWCWRTRAGRWRKRSPTARPACCCARSNCTARPTRPCKPPARAPSRRASAQATQAKSGYISAISHELRTPLNSILGYAQLMSEDPGLPPQRQQAVHVIRRGGEHLLSLIEGTLDIARIESGKLALEVTPMRFADGLREMASLFELQAAAKGLAFRFEPQGVLPEV